MAILGVAVAAVATDREGHVTDWAPGMTVVTKPFDLAKLARRVKELITADLQG